MTCKALCTSLPSFTHIQATVIPLSFSVPPYLRVVSHSAQKTTKTNQGPIVALTRVNTEHTHSLFRLFLSLSQESRNSCLHRNASWRNYRPLSPLHPAKCGRFSPPRGSAPEERVVSVLTVILRPLCRQRSAVPTEPAATDSRAESECVLASVAAELPLSRKTRCIERR